MPTKQKKKSELSEQICVLLRANEEPEKSVKNVEIEKKFEKLEKQNKIEKCTNSHSIKLTLPYPISANRYWRTRMIAGVARTYVSPEAVAYKNRVALLAKEAGIRSPIKGRVYLNYSLFPHRPRDWKARSIKNPLSWDDAVKCLDLDNAQKVLIDALKNVVIEDDKWIRCIIGHREEPDDGEARIELLVEAIHASI